MKSKLVNTMILSMLLVQQSYYPSIYSSIQLLNQMAGDISEKIVESTIKVPQHSATISGGRQVVTGEDSLTIYQPNEQKPTDQSQKQAKGKKTFADIYLDIMKLEEETYRRDSGGKMPTVFGYQLSILSGVMIHGIKAKG
ncbi:hypothetical protein BAU15_08795 [Enterococcus sp. JM4C]|uniref:hypothetical protein n=1 Tax=Candidatus Enterococcus huntleyi TaxID=1857217 RepID=UPI00137AF762|nr:hypothetical protein [Enterococcus sp. JM4C]KAF1296734.1 hypothetical protein BAU15_08795 [Enterococcus sp. JM4C]